MDNPNSTQNRITGWVVSTKPSGWKPRIADRLPSWKIQTSAPKLATIESVFITSALAGRITERSRTNSTRYVVTTMNRAVRGKSAATRVDDVGDVRRAAADQHGRPAGRRSGPVGVAQVGHEGAALVTVRAVRRVEREGRQVALGRRRQRRRDVPVARAVRVAVEQPVLLEGQARVDVDEALHARDPRIRRQPPRVVVQRGEVSPGSVAGAGRSGSRARSARTRPRRTRPRDGRRRRAMARSAGRIEAVRGVEPDVQERRAEHEQEQRASGTSTATGRRMTRRARRAHGPSTRSAGRTSADGEPVDARRRRSPGRPAAASAPTTTASPTTIAPAIPTERRIMNSNRTRPSSPSRTVSPLKNTARPAVATVTRTLGDALRAGRPACQLLAEPARQQQRVVDAETEPQQGREVEHEDAHRRQRGRPRRCRPARRRPPRRRRSAARRRPRREPKTTSSASAASGREMISLRRRSASDTVWTSP